LWQYEQLKVRATQGRNVRPAGSVAEEEDGDRDDSDHQPTEDRHDDRGRR
jgi:hypothetical protein